MISHTCNCNSRTAFKFSERSFEMHRHHSLNRSNGSVNHGIQFQKFWLKNHGNITISTCGCNDGESFVLSLAQSILIHVIVWIWSLQNEDSNEYDEDLTTVDILGVQVFVSIDVVMFININAKLDIKRWRRTSTYSRNKRNSFVINDYEKIFPF